jgi:nitrite reductase/ring-hydroxylating ferredoxin subunit
LEIAGVCFALIAAIPGIIDFIYTVPPKSSGKKRAAQHGVINVTNVLLFLFVWFYRQHDNASPWLVIALEALGFILLCIAGWLGGTLVYRNLIGVDMRYANAGKWKELSIDQKSGTIDAGASDEMKLNQMKLLRLNGRRVVLGRSEKGYVAFDDHCSHRGGSLAGGSMICGTVQCPWHGSQFDVHNGSVKAGPAKEKIHTYQVSERDGRLYITL